MHESLLVQEISRAYTSVNEAVSCDVAWHTCVYTLGSDKKSSEIKCLKCSESEARFTSTCTGICYLAHASSTSYHVLHYYSLILKS